jgi:hypothetical protein
MPFPCRAQAFPLPRRAAKNLDLSFPFDSHSEVCLIHTCHATPVPCHASTMPRPCRSESNFSRPRHSEAWARYGHGIAWHGMCELASVVQRRHVGHLPAIGFFRLPRGVPRRLLSEAYQSVKLQD